MAGSPEFEGKERGPPTRKGIGIFLEKVLIKEFWELFCLAQWSKDLIALKLCCFGSTKYEAESDLILFRCTPELGQCELRNLDSQSNPTNIDHLLIRAQREPPLISASLVDSDVPMDALQALDPSALTCGTPRNPRNREVHYLATLQAASAPLGRV